MSPRAASVRARAKLRAAALLAVVAALAAGCVVVPTTREVYDANCRAMRREIQLETAVLGQFRGCYGQECTALLATLGVVTAATAVVSGSIAIVGNVLYWAEHEARCRRPPAEVLPQAPAPAAGAPAALPGRPQAPAVPATPAQAGAGR